MIGCMHRRIAIPENVMIWSRMARLESTGDAHPTAEERILYLSYRFNNYRVEYLTCDDDYSNPRRVILDMLELENDSAAWISDYRDTYAYTTSAIREVCEDVYSDNFHVYAGLHAALLSNNHRIMRIFVHEMIVCQIAALYYQTYVPLDPMPDINTSSLKNVDLPLNFAYTDQFHASHLLLISLAEDICASVPYCLNFHLHGSDWDDVKPPVAAFRGNSLLWALHTVAQLNCANPRMRAWSIGRLKKIGSTMGIRQAEFLASYSQKGLDSRVEDRLEGLLSESL